MNFMKAGRTVLTTSLLLGAAMGARAATTYTISCEAEKSGNFALTLTGFELNTAHPNSPAVATAERTTFSLTFRFFPTADYGKILMMLENNESLKSCTLSQAAGTTATAGVNKRPLNAAATEASGPHWQFTNCYFSSVTASGGASKSGFPAESVEVTMTGQRFAFTLNGQSVVVNYTMR